MKWLILLVAVALLGGCPITPEEDMPETADIVVIDGENAGTTPWEWSSIVKEAGNTFALEAGSAIHGLGAYKAYWGGANDACYALRTIPSQSSIYTRLFMNIKVWNAANNAGMIWPIMMDGADVTVRFSPYYHTATGKFGYRLFLRVDGGGVFTIIDHYGDDVFSKDTEYYLDFFYVQGGIGVGGVQMWINGADQGSDFSTYSTAANAIIGVGVGGFYTAAAQKPAVGSYIDFDDVLASTTGPIGAYSAGGDRLLKKYQSYHAVQPTGRATGKK